MTRSEFIEDVTTWEELIDFCHDEGIEDCIADIYSEDDYNTYIDESLREYVRHNGWQDTLYYLRYLPTGYAFYILDPYGNWGGLCSDDEDEFVDYKHNVLRIMDGADAWDDEDEEEEPEIINAADPFDEVPVEHEDISVDDLFAVCKADVQQIERREIEQQKADDELADKLFDELCVASGIA